jgi:hypothetical protein
VAAGRAGRRRRWLRLTGCGLAGLLALALVATAYQILRAPSQIPGLVAGPAPRAPRETWARYGSAFRAHATPLVRPELLAALAQAESQGDPLARTPWRWRWTWNVFELWAPASSAAGLFQLTDAAFEEGRRLCVHDGRVAREGPWYDRHTCWFTWSYSRLVPGHAIEMTAARLHELIARTLGPEQAARIGRAPRERLAAVIHLCGPARGAAFARRGFRIAAGERCGTHDLAGYVTRVEALTRVFARLSAA